jgi:hypothetical protein
MLFPYEIILNIYDCANSNKTKSKILLLSFDIASLISKKYPLIDAKIISRLIDRYTFNLFYNYKSKLPIIIKNKFIHNIITHILKKQNDTTISFIDKNDIIPHMLSCIQYVCKNNTKQTFVNPNGDKALLCAGGFIPQSGVNKIFDLVISKKNREILIQLNGAV